MPDFLNTIILGLVEGITEFLPISSTAHLVLASALLELGQTEFMKTFEIAIQLGAIGAVVVLYWKLFWRKEIILRLLVAVLPVVVLGALFYKTIKGVFLENIGVILLALFLGGVALIIFDYHPDKNKKPNSSQNELEKISLKNSFIIGLFQSLSMIPGVSRAAATIFGGLFLGISRKTIVEFSFLLAVPTMVGATTLEIFKNYQNLSAENFLTLALGFSVSFITAILGIKFFLSYIQKNSFVAFGVYRIVLAALFFLLFY